MSQGGPAMPLPTVRVLVLGGTITMVPGAEGGITPTLTGEDLLRQVPALADVAAIAVETPFLKPRSEEHTSELQSLMRISYAVFCSQKKIRIAQQINATTICTCTMPLIT